MKYRRMIPILILGTLILSACSDKTDLMTDTGTPDQTADTGIQTEGNDGMLRDAVPEKDYGGAPFRILTGIHSTYPVDTYSAEQNGDLLDDTLYARNLRLAERFHIVFEETVLDDIFLVNDKLRETVLAGENAYEMMMQIDRFALSAGMEGSLLSYHELPYIDLSQPYWNQNAKEDFTVDNKLFFTYGDDNLVFFGSTTVLAFNKGMIETYSLENPYQLVYDGVWTYDKYLDMNKAVASDLNGDNKMTIDDRWGTVMAFNSFYPNFWLQDGFKLIEKDKDDLPYFNVPGNEPLLSLMVRLAEDGQSDLWYDINSRTDFIAEYGGDHAYNVAMNIFSDEKALFVSSSLINIMDARDMNTDFGILPYPASEEKGKGYIYGSRTFGGFPYVVPITVENTEMVSAIMEASACDSYNTVIPVLYDKVLKVKNARDEDSAKMLDMIRQNRITDLAETYWWDDVEAVYEEELRAGRTTIASKTEQITKRVQLKLEDTIAFFKALDDRE